MADYREVAPEEYDKVTPFAKGEFPATYGGLAGSAPPSSGGFREVTPEEYDSVTPLKPLKAPPQPSLMERATGAIKNALPSMPSMETVKSYLPSFPGTRPAPPPKPPTELNPQFAVDDEGNVTDTTTGKNILEPKAPAVVPAPAPAAPSLLSGIKERLRSLIPQPQPQAPGPPPPLQVSEMPDMGANIPSAIKEPPPPLYGAAKVRAENEASKGWQDRLSNLAKAAGSYLGAEPAHEFTPSGEDIAGAVPQGIGKAISTGGNALITGALQTLTPPLNTPAAQKMVPFPGLVQAIQGKPPMTTDLAGKPTPDLGAIVNPIPEIVSDAFRAGTEAVSSIKPEFYPTLGQDIAGAVNTAIMNAPGSPHVPLGQALNYARGRLFGDWGKFNPETAAKLSSTEPLRDLSPEDAAAVGDIARQSSDAHIQHAMNALDPQMDPRYKIYADEWARRQKGGGKPEAPAAAAPKPGGEQPPGPTGGALPAPEGFKEKPAETTAPTVSEKPPESKPLAANLTTPPGEAPEVPPGGKYVTTPNGGLINVDEGQIASGEGAKGRLEKLGQETKPIRLNTDLTHEMNERMAKENDPFTLFDVALMDSTPRDIKQTAANRINELRSQDVSDYLRSETDQAKLLKISRSGLFPNTYREFAKALANKGTEPTPAGPQAVIPGSREGPRTIPETGLRPKVGQTEKPFELEQPGIAAKEPELPVGEAPTEPKPPAQFKVGDKVIFTPGVGAPGQRSTVVGKEGDRYRISSTMGEVRIVNADSLQPFTPETKPAEAKPSIEEKIAAAEAEQKRLREAAKAKAKERVEKAKEQKGGGIEVIESPGALAQRYSEGGVTLTYKGKPVTVLGKEGDKLRIKVEGEPYESRLVDPRILEEGKAPGPRVQTPEEYADYVKKDEKARRLEKLVGAWKDFEHKGNLAMQRNEPNRAQGFYNTRNNLEREIQQEFGEEGLKAIGRIPEKAEPKAPPAKGSFKVEISDGSDFNSNALRFATEEEAKAYADDLMSRWMAAKESRVVPSDEPVNRKWVNGKLEPIDSAPAQAQIEQEGESSGHAGQNATDVAHGQRAGEDAGTLPQRQDTGDRGPVGEGHPAGGPLHQGAGETGNVGAGGGGPGGGAHPRPERRPRGERPAAPADTGPVEGADNRPSGSAGGGVSPPGGKQGGTAPQEVAPNYSLPKDHDWIPVGLKSRVSANIEAVKTLNELEKTGRAPTPEEQTALSKYVGWGGLKPVFDSGKAAYRDSPPRYDFQKEEWENWEKAWGKQYDEVKKGLTPDEYRSAKASLDTQHYTSRTVINKIWDAVERLGFHGGTALEPAIGVGNFVGLTPQAIKDNVRWRGVDIDSVSARIAKALYPRAKIDITPYEKAKIAPNSQDLVITNVPFSDITVHDSRFPDFNLHNYYFARSIDAAKPGGVIAFITSSYTMDAPTSIKARQYMAERADLIGAIRLPNTTFKGNANTEVTTDVIFLRKKDATSFPGERWDNVVDSKTYDDKPVKLNEYYAKHPDMMLGRMSLEGRQYGKDMPALLPSPGKDFAAELTGAVSKLPENVLGKGAAAPQTAAAPEPGELTGKPGTYVVSGNTVVRVSHDGKPVKPAWANDPAKVVQAKRFVSLRDARNRQVAMEKSPEATEKEVEAGRKDLAKQYDEYLKKHGEINGARSKYLRDDTDFVHAGSLEKPVYSFRTIKNGRQQRVTNWQKSDILTKRTGHPNVPPSSVETIPDAYEVSSNFKGAADPEYIAQLTGKPVEQVIAHLEQNALAFQDPTDGLWYDGPEYLSGFVRQKLEAAKEAAKLDPRYQKHVEELEKVQPKRVSISKASVTLGADWIPPATVQQWARQILQQRDLRVTFTPATATWILTEPRVVSAANATTWGVKNPAGLDATGGDIISDALNGRPAIVWDTHRDENNRLVRTRNDNLTVDARAKQARLRKEFSSFIKTTEGVSQAMEDLYNERQNFATLPQHRPPSWQHYPGATDTITLRDDQKVAATRGLRQSLGLFHAPGNGKTFIMTTIGMEAKRLGIANKVMIVVHNSTAEQFPSEAQRLYPAAKIMHTGEHDFDPAHRTGTMARIATGDWDLVIIPQSQYDMIAVDKARVDRWIQDQLDELERARIEMARIEGENSPQVRDIVRAQRRVEAQLEELANIRTDDAYTFEQLGVDFLMVDEFHAYKKLAFTSNRPNIKGLDRTFSKRGVANKLKMMWIQEHANGRNTLGATGTPISNTSAEAWNMMRYLRPDVLNKYGIDLFDQFASNYGDTKTDIELTSGGSWKEDTRFTGYTNAQNLVKAWKETGDVVTQDMVKLKDLPIIKGGGTKIIEVPQTPELTQAISWIRSQLEGYARVTGRMRRQLNWIPGTMYTMGKKAAVDMRLIDPTLPDNPGSKLNAAVREIQRLYKDYNDIKGTIWVFLDVQNDAAGKAAVFNTHQDIRNKLIKGGIPANEIVVMDQSVKGARRAAVREKFKSGDIRILIGHSDTLGTGFDAADRSVGLIHVDTPDTPAKMEQRTARAVRQGNMNKEVEVISLGVKDSLDAARFQMLTRKQAQLNQLMRGEYQGNYIEDPTDDVFLDMQKQLAAYSGNPLAYERFKLENEIKTLDSVEGAHREQVSRSQRELLELRDRVIPFNERQLDAAKKAAAEFKGVFDKGYTPELKLNGKTYTGEKDVKAAIETWASSILDDAQADALKKKASIRREAGAFELNGRPIVADAYASVRGVFDESKQGPERIYYEADVATIYWRFKDGPATYNGFTTGTGFLQNVPAQVERIMRDPETQEVELATKQRNERELKNFVERPWDQAAELKEKREQLKDVVKLLQAGAGWQVGDPVTAKLTDGGDEFHGEIAAVGGDGQLTIKPDRDTEQQIAHGLIGDLKPGDPIIVDSSLVTLHKEPDYPLAHHPEEQRQNIRETIRQRLEEEAANKATAEKLGDRNAPGRRSARLQARGRVEDLDKANQELAKDAEKTLSNPAASEFSKQSAMETLQELGVIEENSTLEEAIRIAEEREAAEVGARKAEGERGSIGLPGGNGPPVAATRGGIIQYLNRDKTERDLTRGTIREYGGDRFRKNAQAEHAMELEIKKWDKAPIAPSLRFIDAMETGGKQLDPANVGLADALRTMLDQGRDDVQALGTGKLENYLENYFPHVWSQPGQAQKLFARLNGKRPLEGPASFLKKRTIPTTADGIAAGLTPVTYNPVRLALYKINEMNRYVMAHRIKDELIKEGLAKFVRFGKKPPEGWQLLDDKIFRVLQWSEAEQGFINRGSYYAPADAAKSFNNFLSPGLSKSLLYQTARKLGNTLNQAQLGFSFFHLGFTSIDAITSDVALGIEQAVRGQPGKALKSIARGATLVSPIENALVGNRLLKEYLSPGSYAQFSREADALALAGGRPFMDVYYKNQAIESFWKAWKEGDWARLGLRAFPAAMEQMSKPVMEYIVPRQKLGVFAKLASDILERADDNNWNDQRIRQEVQKAWDSVDNRMGQLVYDNLFANKVIKDLGMASVRSLGWNIGTVRELGGGTTDFVMQGARMARGQRPEMTHRMAYLLALPIVVGFLGAIYNFLATGEKPRDVRDYYFPRTGSKDAAGREERVSLPSYWKDVYAFYKHPLTTIGHKVHPAVSAVIEMLNNQDFYGTEIRHPGDPLIKQVYGLMNYVAGIFTPFSIRNAKQRAKAAGEKSMFGPGQASKTVQSFVGVTPAPASIARTDAEEVAGDFLRRRVPGGAKTAEQAELHDTAKLIEQRYALGKMTSLEVMAAARAGGLTINQAHYIIREAKQPYLVRSVKRLTLEEALKVWDVAEPQERAQIKKLLLQKRATVGNLPPEARRRVLEKYRAAPGLSRSAVPPSEDAAANQ